MQSFQWPSHDGSFCSPLPPKASVVLPLQLPTVEELISGSGGRVSSLPTAEEQLARAFQEGAREGRLEGERIAEERLEAKSLLLDAQIALFQDVVKEMRLAAIAGILVKESDLAAFAVEIATQILGFEPDVNRRRLREGIQSALSHIEPETDIRIRVHPSQADHLSETLRDPDLLLSHAPVVVPDPTIELGGVMIEAGPTRIDTQIKTALERLRTVLGELGDTEQ